MKKDLKFKFLRKSDRQMFDNLSIEDFDCWYCIPAQTNEWDLILKNSSEFLELLKERLMVAYRKWKIGWQQNINCEKVVVDEWLNAIKRF